MADAILANRLYLKNLADYEKSSLIIYTDDEFVTLYNIIKIKGQDYYSVPRYFKTVSNIVDKRTNGEDINISMNSKYKPRNTEQEKAIQALCNNENGILAAHVGFGKTYVATEAICKIKKKALIIVHKLALIDQWREKLTEYTNLRNNNIGIIQGNDFDIDKPIVIASIATLVSRLKSNMQNIINDMYNANFGVTVYDECHITTGAMVFSQSTLLVFSKRLYGLSATPYRSDGSTELIKYHIGNIIYSNLDIKLPIYVIALDIPVSVAKSRRYIMWGGKFNKQRYISTLLKSDVYIELLAEVIKTLVSTNRNVLLLSDRIELLKKLFELVKDDVDVSLIYGSRKRDYNHQVILATMGLFREGIDVPHLDTIVYGTPLTARVGLTQSIGRVARVTDGKKYILIIDIRNSSFDVAEFMYKRRKLLYNNMNANVIESKGFLLNDIKQIEKRCLYDF